MEEHVDGLIRIGKVSSINPKKCTARVLFEDRSELVSYDFPIVVPFTLKDRAYYMPAIDERVLCVILPNKPAQGFIMGSFYADTRKPPVTDENKTHVIFEDGTFVEYDKKENKITLKCVGYTDVHIQKDTKTYIEGDSSLKRNGENDIHNIGDNYLHNEGNINVTCDADVTVEVAGNVTVNVVGNTTVNSVSPISINGASTIDVNASAPLTINSGADLDIISAGHMTIKSGGSLKMTSNGEMALNGALIRLN